MKKVIDEIYSYGLDMVEGTSCFGVTLPAYDFHLQRHEGEKEKDFKVRLQKELDRLYIPVEVE